MRYKTQIMIFCFSIIMNAQENKNYKVNTIAFYNLENLFDYEDDPRTFDDDRTPNGKDNWTEEIYNAKIKNMARSWPKLGVILLGPHQI